MADIVIYTKPTCPFCLKAKKLLQEKNLTFKEIDASGEKREEMRQRANGRNTFPQIFINEKHIGGCDDLYNLENSGKLEEILKSKNI